MASLVYLTLVMRLGVLVVNNAGRMMLKVGCSRGWECSTMKSNNSIEPIKTSLLSTFFEVDEKKH